MVGKKEGSLRDVVLMKKRWVGFEIGVVVKAGGMEVLVEAVLRIIKGSGRILVVGVGKVRR